MSEWPPAPRLTNALRRRAEGAEVSPEGWELIAARLGSEGQRVKAAPSHAPDSRGRRTFVLVGAAAALVAVGVVGFVVMSVRDQGRDYTVTAGPDAASSVAADDPGGLREAGPSDPPFLVTDDGCADLTDAVAAYRIDTADGSYQIGVAAKGEPLAAWIRIVDEGWREAAAGDRFAAMDDELVAYLPSGIPREAALEVVETFVQAGCRSGSPSYLVASDGPGARSMALDLLCSSQYRTGFMGLAMIGAPVEPNPCVGHRPVMLVASTPATDPVVQSWAAHQGCSGPSSRQDRAGNVVTEWERCDATLLHVEFAADDVWSVEVDGVPLNDYLRLLATIPL